jgi:hypothetical protein
MTARGAIKHYVESQDLPGRSLNWNMLLKTATGGATVRQANKAVQQECAAVSYSHSFSKNTRRGIMKEQ